MFTILPHIVWLQCEFRMQVWNVLHAARWKYRTQKIAKKSLSGHHRALSGYIFATKKACIDNRKETYLFHVSSQYGELRPTNGWDRFTSLGHPSKFQRVSRLAFSYLLQRRRSPEANQTLHDVWPSPALARYIYIFAGSCPLTEFCQVQSSLYDQVLRSLLLAALLHGTPCSGRQPNFAAWYKEWNYGTFAEVATYIRLGGHHVGHQPTF